MNGSMVLAAVLVLSLVHGVANEDCPARTTDDDMVYDSQDDTSTGKGNLSNVLLDPLEVATSMERRKSREPYESL